MLVNFAGVDLPYHSSDFLLDSMRGFYGRMGGNADRNLFASGYAFKINLNSCLPGIGSVSEGLTNDRIGQLFTDGSFFIDGETYTQIMRAVNTAGGFGSLTLQDDHATLSLGQMFLARRILIRDGLVDADRVWLISLYNGNDFYRSTSAMAFALGTARQQIYPEYLVDEPEEYSDLARYAAAVDLGVSWLTQGIIFGTQIRPRLLAVGDRYFYGLPRTIRVASANAILDGNLQRWGGRIIHGAILGTEIEGADFNRRPEVPVAWQNVNSAGVTQTTGTEITRLGDVYAVTPWLQAVGGTATSLPPTAVAGGASRAQSLAKAYGKSWYRWYATALRIHGGQPGLFARRWDESVTNATTFAGLVPWEFAGVEGSIYFLAGAGEWEIPCTVVTTGSLVHNHNSRNASGLAVPINPARSLGTIEGTAPAMMSGATITRTATGNSTTVSATGTPRGYRLTGVPDGEYTVTRIGTASPTLTNATVEKGSTATANFS
jgi:hypothetical protein